MKKHSNYSLSLYLITYSIKIDLIKNRIHNIFFKYLNTIFIYLFYRISNKLRNKFNYFLARIILFPENNLILVIKKYICPEYFYIIFIEDINSGRIINFFFSIN